MIRFQLALRAGSCAVWKQAPYGYDDLGTADSLQGDDAGARWRGFHAEPLRAQSQPAGADRGRDSGARLASWPKRPLARGLRKLGAAAIPPAAPEAPERKILIVDKPGSPQTTLLTFGVGMERKSPDYPAVTVMNKMLGGLFSSRINMNLREEHGYTYGAFSFYWFYRGTDRSFRGAGAAGCDGAGGRTVVQGTGRNPHRPLTDTELRQWPRTTSSARFRGISKARAG